MTAYETIFDNFRVQVLDFDMIKVPEDVRYNMLMGFMNAAQAYFQTRCTVDLSDRDDVLGQYNQSLGVEEIHIMVLGMVWAWYNYRLNQSDNLMNYLNTRDYNMASAPGRMLESQRAARDGAWDAFRQALIDYSYLHGGVDQLKP
jgi:hypothetical protein